MIRETPLIDACKQPEKPSRILAIARAEPRHVNLAGKRFRTPLMWACLRAHPDAAEGLIALGAAIEARDICGMTAYLLCAHAGRADMMHLLHTLGADTRAENTLAENALMLGAATGHAEAVAVALSHRVSPYLRNLDWDTPLDIAKRRGHKHVILSLQSATDISLDAATKRAPQDSRVAPSYAPI